MVFQQPQKFLDLCGRLKTTKPLTEGAKEFASNKPGVMGFAFEYVTSMTLTDLAKGFGAVPLQKKEASALFRPFAADCSPQTGQGYTVFRSGEPLAEFDAIFKANANEYWFFEATSVVKDEYQFFPNKQLLLLWGLAKQNKIACAYVMPHDAYERFSSDFFSKYQKVAKELLDLNAVLTYLPITRDELHNIVGRKKT